LHTQKAPGDRLTVPGLRPRNDCDATILTRIPDKARAKAIDEDTHEEA